MSVLSCFPSRISVLLLYKRINLGGKREVKYTLLSPLWTVELGPQSLGTDTQSAAQTIRHFSFLCLTRALIGMKLQNSKAPNLFSLPESWEEHDFFQECSNWSVYSRKHHQNMLLDSSPWTGKAPRKEPGVFPRANQQLCHWAKGRVRLQKTFLTNSQIHNTHWVHSAVFPLLW